MKLLHTQIATKKIFRTFAGKSKQAKHTYYQLCKSQVSLKEREILCRKKWQKETISSTR